MSQRREELKTQRGPVTPAAGDMGLRDPGRAALARGSGADLGGTSKGRWLWN